MTISRRAFLRASGLASLHALRRPAWASTAPGPIRLHNGAQGSGLDFVLRNGAQGSKYQVETLPGGLGVIDYDGDGWPDLFCVNGASLPSLTKSGPEYWNRLYRNNRDGTFTDVTRTAALMGTGYGMGVAVADYNNDGHEDLFVVGVHSNQLYRNNGDGTFTDVTDSAGLNRPSVRKLWSIAAAWIDYDFDGRLDLFISNYCDWEPGTDKVCGGMTPGTRVYCHPDLYHPESMQLFHNNGDGTFTEVTRGDGLPNLLGKGMGIAMSGFSPHHPALLFVANDNARNLLLRGNGHGFEEIGVEAGVAYNGDGRNISGMGADFGDIDGDGLPDLVMTGLKNETYEVFLNRSDGIFVDGSASTGLLGLSRHWSGWGCGLIDLDNDGWLDLFVAGGGLDTTEGQPNQIFHNTRGKFSNVSEGVGAEFATPALHRGVVFADFDCDGRIDAAVTALNAPIELWWNRSPKRNWLQLRLQGRRSNRSAIGAQVTCKTSKGSRSRTVTNCVGYASSSDLAVHFGLDTETKASVKIEWPSGIVQELGEVAANQQLRVQEPA
jgi:enediyne biosynthesis protein E4